jgi:hypothetical protein
MLDLEINAPLKSFDGNPIMVAGAASEPFTIKVALLNCLGSKTPKDGKEAIEVYRLGCAIYDRAGEILNTNEIALLKSAVEENKPGYTSIVLGQLLMFLEK